jgi:hypothetical protein
MSTNTIDMEVSNLFNVKNKNEINNRLMNLRNKYPKDEDLVNQIQKVFSEKHNSIQKSAHKFAEAIRNKYSNNKMPYHTILEKARSHAKKHHLSEAEFAEFQRIYEQDISGTNQTGETTPSSITNLMKVLGNASNIHDNYFNVHESDYRNLEEILKLYEISKPLHAQTMLQNMQYNDLALQSLTGLIDPARQNPNEHVSPIIAALFLPKIDTINHHFLYSNIAGIVKSRYNGTPLTTRPDYELFYNLVTDPNDVVCDSTTPIIDLLHRCNLQNQLWNAVLHLRNGQYFNPSFKDFITSVDICRLNKYDNPDFIYGRNDGSILKRLLAAFSFRPTIVTTLPTAFVFATNPYAQNVRPVVTAIPMINVRLANWNNLAPTNIYGGTAQRVKTPIKLSETLTQVLPFIENGRIVQRVSDVIYSREVIIFFVDRRAVVLTNDTIPYNMGRLPTAVAGFERINDMELFFEPSINVKTDIFCLRSVVCADTKVIDNMKMVIGSSAILFEPYNKKSGVFSCNRTISGTPLLGNFGSDNIYHYDPMNSLKRPGHETIYQAANIGKISKLTRLNAPPTLSTSDKNLYKIRTATEIKDYAMKNGIIYIYQNYKYEENNNNLLTY